MHKFPIRLLAIMCILLFVSACSDKDKPLIVESDSKREEVITEVDIFQDMMYRLNNVYFPTDVGHLERMSISYEVENDELKLEYKYNTYHEKKEKGLTIPSRISLYVNHEDANNNKFLEGKGRYFALDSLEGYIQERNGQITFLGTDNEYDDEFLYVFDDIEESDSFQAIFDIDMQKRLHLDYVKGYAFFDYLFQLDMEDQSFLDLQHTNFEIKKISMQIVNSFEHDKPSLGSELYITYGYEDYTFTLSMSTLGTRNAPSYRVWEENGYEYYVHGNYSGEQGDEFKIEKEDYKEFIRFINRKITDE